MAKYIELNELQKFCRKYTEHDAIQLILNDRTDLMHTVDAIECSKINKTIKEIEDEIKFWDEESTDPSPYTAEIRKHKANSYKHALEILKSDIGKTSDREVDDDLER